LIDRAGVVRARFHEDDYRKRYTLGGLLLREFDAPPAGPVHDVPAKRIKLRLAASAAEARPGQRITLMIEMELRPGLHVYAPGAAGYQAVAWSIDASPAFTAHPVNYPPSRSLHLPAIGETVPVFENRVRLLRDVTIDSKAPPGEIVITGAFHYQACDDRICYPPETVPAAWKLHLAPHDRERSAASPRRKLQ
jgi:DsbC/DsbD-like thiol-disulfide interchange protein